MALDLPPHLENDPRGRERKLFEKAPFIRQGT
jgi:para-nitrobenzyl esterase